MWAAKVRRLISAAAILLAAAGCSHSVSVSLPAKKMVVLVYADGHVAQRCYITPTSPKFQKLSELMKHSEDGWHMRIGSYVPTMLVVGPDVTLNFMGSNMVMNYDGHEYERSIAADSYAFLDCKVP